MIERSAWRLRGEPGPALRHGVFVALPVGVTIAIGFSEDPKVAGLLSLSMLLAGFIAFDAPARTRSLWLLACAPIAGVTAAIGTLSSEPTALAVVVIAIGGSVAGFMVAVSPRAYVAGLTCLLGLLIAQGLFLGADEAPLFLLLGALGTALQALVAWLAHLSWDHNAEPFGLAAKLRGARAALIANLRRNTVALGHALRFGGALGAAVLTYHLLGYEEHGYWIPLTVLFVLRPDPDETLERIAMRAAGTGLGVILGTALAELVGTEPVAVGLVVMLMMATAYALLTLEYAIFTTAITTAVIVISHALGEPAFESADERAVDSAIGLAIVAAALIAWRVYPGRPAEEPAP